MLSGQNLCIESDPKRDCARYEAAGIIRRGGARRNDEVRELQRLVIGDSYTSTYVSGSYTPAVDYVDLDKRAFTEVANRDVWLKYGGFGRRKLLSGEIESVLSSSRSIGSGAGSILRSLGGSLRLNPLLMSVSDSQGQSHQSESSNDESQAGNDNAGNVRPRWFVFRNRYADCVAVVFTYVCCFLLGFWLIRSAGNIKDITIFGISKVVTEVIVILSVFAFVIHAAILLFEAL